MQFSLECVANLLNAVGHILEEEIANGGNAGPAGKLKTLAIDTWAKHGVQPYDPIEVDEPSKVKKANKKLESARKKAVASAIEKEKNSTRPKFPISWFEQTRILGHRAFWGAVSHYTQIIPNVQTVLVALIVGAVWWQTPYATASLQDLLGVCFFMAMYSGAFVPLLEAVFNCASGIL